MGNVVETYCLNIDVDRVFDLIQDFYLLGLGTECFLLMGTFAYLKVIESAYLTDLSFQLISELLLVLIGG